MVVLVVLLVKCSSGVKDRNIMEQGDAVLFKKKKKAGNMSKIPYGAANPWNP